MILFRNLIIFILIIILSLSILILFNNPYPCMTSGCGCENIWEALNDSWASIVSISLFVYGLIWFIYNHQEPES